MTQADEAQYDYDIDNDESNIPIQVGEKLTELQMLEALMNQSANDIAYSLALWDSGTLPAFVAKMNALAASLGAVHSHYVDASGYDPHSVSTASDTLRIAAAGMRIPAFAAVVNLPTVSLPLVGTVHNIVTQIGTNGVVGVKSGYTSQAGGCMVLASYQVIGGRSVLVLASALGQHVPPRRPPPRIRRRQPDIRPRPPTTTTTSPSSTSRAQYPLRYAGPFVETLLDASKAAIVRCRWSPAAKCWPRSRLAGRPRPLRWRPWPGEGRGCWAGRARRVASVVKFGAVPAGARAGTRAGNALYALGQQIESVPLTITATVPEPSWWWRLVHG